jgi:hypothetical protein
MPPSTFYLRISRKERSRSGERGKTNHFEGGFQKNIKIPWGIEGKKCPTQSVYEKRYSTPKIGAHFF